MHFKYSCVCVAFIMPPIHWNMKSSFKNCKTIFGGVLVILKGQGVELFCGI